MIRALLIGLVLLAGASQVSARDCGRDCDRDFRLARATVDVVETTVELGTCTVKHVVVGTYHVIHCVQPVRSTVEFVVEKVREDKPVRRALKALVQKVRDRNCCDETCDESCELTCEPSCGCAGV